MKEYPVNLHRFDDTIAEMQTRENPQGKILLYGSSFFTNWKEAKEQMLEASNGKYHVVNRGFGGATIDELLLFYRKLVVPNAPRAVLFRIGPNDIFNNFTLEETKHSALQLMEFLRADYPGIKLGILCVFEYPSTKEEFKAPFAALNAYFQEYAAQTEDVWYVDINEFFYETPADVGTFENFRDIFRKDGLHLRPEIYREFAEYFTKKLDEIPAFGNL